MTISNTCNSNYSWSNLPPQILHSVLYFAQHTSQFLLQNNVPLLNACQLVCKGWSKAAQEALYNQVYLGSNTLSFLTTIIDSKELAGLTNILVFEKGIADHGEIFDLLEDIITRCPHIEELYSLEDSVRNHVWAYLSSAKNVPQHLKAFTTTTFDAVNTPLYSAIALRFEETLTRLQLCFNATLMNSIDQGFHSLLTKRLNHFVSLQQLRVDHWQVRSWQDLDTLLTSCSATLRELVFIHLDLSNSRLPTAYRFSPNTNLKQLKIAISSIPPATFQYLKRKMAALERFDLLFISFPNGSFQDIDLWWACLMELCMDIKAYTIKFTHSGLLDMNQMRNCMKFSAATTTQWKDIKDKTSDISFDASQDGDNAISLSKSWQKYAIQLEFDTLSYPDIIFQWLQMYSPHHIHTKAESMDSLYQTMASIEPECAARSLLERTCNKAELHSLFSALSRIAGTNNARLHFENIVLCRTLFLGNYKHASLQTSDLKFTNSILQHQVLECVSQKFVKISKLTLDTCCIIMDSPFHLDVRLPFTEIVDLELRINPFVNATHWSSQKKKIYSDVFCCLENLDLLRAVSEDGHFMVKIETQDKTYVFHKQGCSKIKRIHIDPNHVECNAFTFVILVKCKQLREMRIVGEHGLKWVIKLD
ncbi:hypothetical protein PS15p_210197 [Mucor circinelloides]